MAFTKTFVITLLLFISLSSKAQYYKLLNLTEKQVREKVTEFPFVTRDSSKHEFVTYLTFKNKNNEIQLVCYFFFDSKCYLIYNYSKKESYESTVDWANKSFNQISENRWRSKDNTFEISIHSLPEKVATIFSRGISRY